MQAISEHHLSIPQESDVTTLDSPFEVQADKRNEAGGHRGGRRSRTKRDKPPDQPAVAAN